ncbi:MAG: hypothetical protein ABI333_12635 [bacterium]
MGRPRKNNASKTMCGRRVISIGLALATAAATFVAVSSGSLTNGAQGTMASVVTKVKSPLRLRRDTSLADLSTAAKGVMVIDERIERAWDLYLTDEAATAKEAPPAPKATRAPKVHHAAIAKPASEVGVLKVLSRMDGTVRSALRRDTIAMDHAHVSLSTLTAPAVADAAGLRDLGIDMDVPGSRDVKVPFGRFQGWGDFGKGGGQGGMGAESVALRDDRPAAPVDTLAANGFSALALMMD